MTPTRPAPLRTLALWLAGLAGCGDDVASSASEAMTSTLPPSSEPTTSTGSSGGVVPTGSESGGGMTDGATGTSGVGEASSSTSSGATSDATTSGTTTSGTSGGEESSGGGSSTGGPVDVCKVQDDLDGMVPCTDEAPPDSFEPDIQWVWMGEGMQTQVLVTPVVANLTDDNGDGAIDLCDVPDIVVVAYGPASLLNVGTMFALDGATGAVHWSVPEVNAITYPAVGDIDGDGLPEIVTGRTQTETNAGQLLVIEHDGAVKFVGAETYNVGTAAVALADLDADGDVEIVHHAAVFDHNGVKVWGVNDEQAYVNVAADLDDDGKMEVILGPTAFRHDGSPYFNAPVGFGHPQVADLDDDGLPEVLLVGIMGLTVLEHDGTVKVANQLPNLANYRPAAIHDFDGDMAPEIAAVSTNSYSVVEADFTVKWTAPIQDGGFASSTAFDFLGDGSAEAMYGDEVALFIFGGAGEVLLTSPRGSWTQWENPIVADVDNDGSAEIVVVSNKGYENFMQPAVQVIRDKQDRWIPARRIWNQHTYHVTNVREDGTIPQVEPKSWLTFNTFRTQAQVSLGGGVCQPDPQ